MKILYPNLNRLDLRCDGAHKTKEQRSSIPIVVPSKTEWLGKKSKNSMNDVIEISIA